MQKSQQDLWLRFQRYYSSYPAIGLSIDLSRMNFPDDYFDQMAAPMAKGTANNRPIPVVFSVPTIRGMMLYL